MTRKLYYEDAYLTAFDTTIARTGQDDNGFFVILEETAFYPTGGGQPSDRGALNGAPVSGVEEVDGDIRHYLEEPMVVGGTVHGEIDWARRFDHMQQHCGQHILSAVMEDRFQWQTTSFHLGEETVTIDLDTSELLEETLTEAEAEVNRLILKNIKVETAWMTAEEAGKYPLRKKLAVTENVRLVMIPGVDYNGCGGTHPQATGEVRAVKLLGWTKNKGQVRLEFVCGERLLGQFGKKHRLLTELKQLVARPEEALPEEIVELNEKSKEKDKYILDLKSKLIGYEAKELVEQGEQKQFLSAVYQDRSIKQLQTLGQAVLNETTDVCVLLVSEQEDALQFVLACGSGLDRNMNDVAKQVLPHIEGKGGGKPHFVQGGGKKRIKADAFVELVKNIV
ncbi:UNVERIFIED_CONTAM: DHHA1 domain-containing protein [Halobacillus marinus]